MNSFRTAIDISQQKGMISHKKKGLAIGSCFVENIGGWLRQSKFDLSLNPYGIVYNPISIAAQLASLLENTTTPIQLESHNNLWHSMDHHSSFSGAEKEEVIKIIQHHFELAKQQLQQADYLILTFGTANVYTQLSTKKIVSNCHKFSNNLFSKRRVSVKEVIQEFVPIFEKLNTTLPNLKIILTVSPIRHLKDGFIENQRSKAVLLLTVDNLVKQFEHATYFPSYEIMMDDLRDYRFYDKDMLHPNEIAIDYIKGIFSQAYFDDSTMQLQKEISGIQQAVAHRPFHPSSPGHQDFLNVQLGKITDLEKRFPTISWQEEKIILEKQLV